MVREIEGGPGKEKDIIGSSAQGFGTDLVIIKNFFNLYLSYLSSKFIYIS